MIVSFGKRRRGWMNLGNIVCAILLILPYRLLFAENIQANEEHQRRLDSLQVEETKWLELWSSKREVLGIEHPETMRCLENMAIIAYSKGDWDRAESLYVQIISIREKLTGEDRIDLVYSLSGLASVCENKCNYQKAEDLLKRAIDIAKGIDALSDPMASHILYNNLGNISSFLGKFKQAEDCYQRLLASIKKTAGPKSIQLQYPLHHLERVNIRLGNYKAAAAYAQQALEIIEDSLGLCHPRLQLPLFSLEYIYRRLGRIHEAEQALHRYRNITIDNNWSENDKKRFSSDYRYLGFHWEARGDGDPCLWRMLDGLTTNPDDISSYLEYAMSIYEIRYNNLEHLYTIINEQEALQYAHFIRSAGYGFLSFYFLADSRLIRQRYLDMAAAVIISLKGTISDEIFKRNKILYGTNDLILMALRDSLQTVTSYLSNFYVKDLPKISSDESLARADSLRSEKNRLINELARYSAIYLSEDGKPKISAEHIAMNLPTNSVLVEYLKYRQISWYPDTAVTKYLVLLIEPNKNVSVLEPLESSNLIDSLVSEYRSHILSTSASTIRTAECKQQYNSIASKLYDLVWAPIADWVRDKEVVFVAPDGVLNSIPFAALPGPDGQYLVEKHAIHYLSAGRDIIRLSQNTNYGKGLLIMGDPDYNANANERAIKIMHERGNIVVPANIYHLMAGPRRNVRSNCPRLKSISVEQLPATRTEMTQVINFWNESFTDSVHAYSGKSATEDNLKQYAPGKRIIHIATHGFFISKNCYETHDAYRSQWAGSFIEENPLLLSGLFLAGANLHGQLADSLGIDDGILTAEEVSCLDLTGVQQVVLSACESGLGQIESGEGVYGLRRAFQMAGAGTVVSSLWPVGDRSAAEFMAFLYQPSDLPLYRKIQLYQKAQIDELRAHGYSDHPYQWAAFIVIGDWK